MKETLLKVREIIHQGWCKDAIAKDSKGNATFHSGAYVEIFGKDKEPIKVFVPATSWSLIGAISLATNMHLFPNKEFIEVLNVLTPLVKTWEFSFGTRHFTYLADFNDYSEKRGKESTKIDDVLMLLDLALVGL